MSYIFCDLNYILLLFDVGFGYRKWTHGHVWLLSPFCDYIILAEAELIYEWLKLIGTASIACTGGWVAEAARLGSCKTLLLKINTQRITYSYA